jgi:hypothetical protein
MSEAEIGHFFLATVKATISLAAPRYGTTPKRCPTRAGRLKATWRAMPSSSRAMMTQTRKAWAETPRTAISRVADQDEYGLIGALPQAARRASRIQVIGSPLVTQSKVNYLLPCTPKPKPARQFAQLARHLSVMFAV